MTGVSFGGNALQTFDGNHGIIVQNIEHAGKNAKQAVAYALGHANKSSIPFVAYPNKPIVVTGQIVGTSIVDCDAQIDTFNSYMLTQGGNLDFDYNGSTRRYIATATNIDVQRPGGLAWADFTVTFTATQPFGQDTTATTALTATGRTASGYTDAYTFLGTAPAQLPLITITFTAITGLTAFVFFGNNSNGQGITVNRTWAVNDVLVIDCVNRTVTVNGVAVNFTGAFTEFAPGVSSLGYSDGFTTRTFNITVTYFKYYL